MRSKNFTKKIFLETSAKTLKGHIVRHHLEKTRMFYLSREKKMAHAAQQWPLLGIRNKFIYQKYQIYWVSLISGIINIGYQKYGYQKYQVPYQIYRKYIGYQKYRVSEISDIRNIGYQKYKVSVNISFKVINHLLLKK